MPPAPSAPRAVALPPAGRFASAAAGLRRVPPWHPLAYIVWLLPRRLRGLATELHVPPHGRVLDFGCAEKPYRGWFADSVEYLGADLPGNPHADLTIGPDGRLDVPDASFDAVLSTQVLEHVEAPAAYLDEAARVLKPGGRLLLSTHGLMVYHPDPVDLHRWTGEGLVRAITAAGLRVERIEGVMGLLAAALLLFHEGLRHRLPRVLRAPVSLCFQLAMAVADRWDGAQSREWNALVFAVIAVKP